MDYNTKNAMKKLLFSLFLIIVNLVFLRIPVIGVNVEALKKLFSSNDMLNMFDAFNGNGLSNLTMGAFSLSSIITVDILMNLLAMSFPKLDDIRNNGESGRLLFKEINLIIAIILTFITSILFVTKGGDFYKADKSIIKALSVIQWTLSTFIIGKLCNINDEKGISQGASLLIFVNILNNVPKEFRRILSLNRKTSIWVFLIMFISILIAIYFSYSYVKIRVIETKKIKTDFNDDTFMIIPFSITSVMPLIYINVFTSIPLYIKEFFKIDNKIMDNIVRMVMPSLWYKDFDYLTIIGILLYVSFLFIFCAYSAMLSFPTGQITNSFKKSNTMMDGIRSGSEMKTYLDEVLKRVVAISFLMILFVSVIPSFIVSMAFDGLTLGLLGTSILILVNIHSNLSLELKAMFRHLSKKYTV